MKRKIFLILIVVICAQYLCALDFNSPSLRGVGKNLSTFFPDRVVDIYNFPFNFVNDNDTSSYYSYMQIWEGAQISSFRVVSKPDYKIGILMNVNYEANDRYFPYTYHYSPYRWRDHGWTNAYQNVESIDEHQDDFSSEINDKDTPETNDDLIISDKRDGIFYEKYNNSGLVLDLKLLLSKPEKWDNVFYLNLYYLRSYDPPEGLHYAKYDCITQPFENNTNYPYDYNRVVYTKLSDCDQSKFEIHLGNSVCNPTKKGQYSLNYSINFLYWKKDSNYFESFESYTIKRFQTNNATYEYEQDYNDIKYNAFGIGTTLQFLKEKQLKYTKSIFSMFFKISRLSSKRYDKIYISDITIGFTRGFYFKPNSFTSAAIGLKGNMNFDKGDNDNYFNATEIRSGNIIAPIGIEFLVSSKLIVRFGWAYHFFSNHNYDWEGSDYNFGCTYKFNNFNINFAINKERAFSKPLLSFSFEKGF